MFLAKGGYPEGHREVSRLWEGGPLSLELHRVSCWDRGDTSAELEEATEE